MYILYKLLYKLWFRWLNLHIMVYFFVFVCWNEILKNFPPLNNVILIYIQPFHMANTSTARGVVGANFCGIKILVVVTKQIAGLSKFSYPLSNMTYKWLIKHPSTWKFRFRIFLLKILIGSLNNFLSKLNLFSHYK